MSRLDKQRDKIMDKVVGTHFHTKGYRASAEYLAGKILGIKVYQRDLAEKYLISEQTIRNNIKKLLKNKYFEDYEIKWQKKKRK